MGIAGVLLLHLANVEVRENPVAIPDANGK
jgi:hypothetical protein